jgi:hypothetical protein
MGLIRAEKMDLQTEQSWDELMAEMKVDTKA